MKKAKAILLITCDELAKEALSCYGNQAVHTDVLDQLCRESTEFTNMYTTSPWCLPARCSLLTGTYPHQNRAYSNFRDCPLDPEMPNLFRMMKKENYYAAMFGKCHFAPVPYKMTRADQTLSYEAFRNYYMSLGMDHLVLEDGKQVSVWFYDDYAKELEKRGLLSTYRSEIWKKENGKIFSFPGEAEIHPDMWVGNQAADFVRNFQGENLFLWLSFSGPHYPFDPPVEYINAVDRSKLKQCRRKEGEFLKPERIHHRSFCGNGGIDGCGSAPNGACANYSEEYWEKLRTYYFANVKLIDDAIGRVLREVESRYGKDSLIIFTADHGEMLGNHGLWGKNNCFYEEVWNIPLFVRFPGQTEGEKRQDLVNTTDILPTCLEAAGGNAGDTVGQSLYRKGNRKLTFAEGEGYVAVTDGRWKYVQVHQDEKKYKELIDRGTDPYEYDNQVDRGNVYKKQSELQEAVIEHLMRDLLK